MNYHQDELGRQKKQNAWTKVERLAREAYQLLSDANEGPVDQSALLHLEAKARVQKKLWEKP